MLVDDKNVLEISLCYFFYNLFLAAISLFRNQHLTQLIENSIPFKGSLLGLSTFTAFTQVPMALLKGYDSLIWVIIPLTAVFEAVQPLAVSFKLSRTFKRRINFNGGFLQISVIGNLLCILIGSGYLFHYIYQSYENSNSKQPLSSFLFILLSICFSIIIIISSIMNTTVNSNLLNGIIPAVFIMRSVAQYSFKVTSVII
jgi:hypothetical protein